MKSKSKKNNKTKNLSNDETIIKPDSEMTHILELSNSDFTL